MTACQRGVTAPSCGICGLVMHLAWPCQQEHPDHCHDCAERNLRGLDVHEHRAPPPQELALSPRDVAALAAYTQHVQRVGGTEALRHLLLEDEP